MNLNVLPHYSSTASNTGSNEGSDTNSDGEHDSDGDSTSSSSGDTNLEFLSAAAADHSDMEEEAIINGFAATSRGESRDRTRDELTFRYFF